MNYAPIVLQTADLEVIQGWYMSKNDPRVDALREKMGQDRRLVVFFHENAGNLGLRLDYFEMLYKELNCDVIALAYRGYSASTGKPSEVGLKRDAQVVMEFVFEDLAPHYVDRGGVFVLGRSLGGAVAAATVSALPDARLN